MLRSVAQVSRLALVKDSHLWTNRRQLSLTQSLSPRVHRTHIDFSFETKHDKNREELKNRSVYHYS